MGQIKLLLTQSRRQKKHVRGTRTEAMGHWIWLSSSTFPHQNRPIYCWLLVFHRQSTFITENSRKRIMWMKCLSKLVVPKLIRAVTQIKVAIMSCYPQYFAS